MPGRERFLILARQSGTATESLKENLCRFGGTEVIVDRKDGMGIFYENDRLSGFDGIMGLSSEFPRFTAWSRAMYHLSLTLRHDDNVWFVEEDVAGCASSLGALVEFTVSSCAHLSAVEIQSRMEDPHWYYWNLVEPWFDAPWHSFSPLCRVSSLLIGKALEFREKHDRFAFHEGMFASLAAHNGFRTLDWRLEPDVSRLFDAYRYRPVVDAALPGICHPVKDPEIHEQICKLGMPPAGCGIMPATKREFSRIDRALLRDWSILQDDYVFLVRYCRDKGVRNIFEFGPGDSTLAFLDAGCRVVSFEHDREWLGRANRRFGSERDVELVYCEEGDTPDLGKLPFLPDLILVDGPPLRPDQQMSRLKACEWALMAAGCFILHDANRHAEQATLCEMERRGMRVVTIPTHKGIAVVVDVGRRPEMLP